MKKIYALFLFIFSLNVFAQGISLQTSSGAVYPDEMYFCTGENFDFQVNASASSTGNYGITSVTTFNLPAPSALIPFSNKVGYDHFSNVINLPFEFDYYGQKYTKVVVGGNGRLLFGSGTDFDNLHTSRYVDKVHSGNDVNSTNKPLPDRAYLKIDSSDPNRELNFAQIFFGFTDIGYYNTAHYNKLTYGNVIYEGVNGVLFNFNTVLERTVSGGYSSTLTSQVLLLEDNRVLIKVNKSSANSNAIIGFQDFTGEKAIWPPNNEPTSVYNNGKWTSNASSSWSFTPNLNLTPQFKWTVNGNPRPESGNSITGFTPSDGDVLKVEVTYHDPSGAQVGNAVTDEIKFKNFTAPVITASGGGACSPGVTLNVNSPDSNLTYSWFKVGNTTSLGSGNSYFANADGDYYVKATRNFLPGCSVDSAPVTVSLSSTLPPFNPNNKAFGFCEQFPFDLSYNVNLYDYYPQDPTKFTVNFFHNGALIPDPTEFPLPPQQLITINLKVSDLSSSCVFDHIFNLVYNRLPNPADLTDVIFCNGSTVIDASEVEYLKMVGGASYYMNFDYLYSSDGIHYSTNSTFNPKIHPKIWYKITAKNNPYSGCQTISTITFSEGNPIIANTPTTQLPPQCYSPTDTFDLASLIPEINNDPNVTVTFHRTLTGAQNDTDAVANNFNADLGTTTLYIRVVDNTTGCTAKVYPSVTLLVYATPNITVTTPIAKTNCPGNTIFNLTQDISQLTDADLSVIDVQAEYYSETGVLLSAAQVAAYDASAFGDEPYIKLSYNPTCDSNIQFKLDYHPLPAPIQNQKLICGETSFSLQDFKNLVINNSGNYTFTDEFGNALPSAFTWTSLPFEVKYFITDNTTGCQSALQTFTFSAGNPTPTLATEITITQCDDDGDLFDGSRTFDLNSVKSAFTSDSNATFDFFKDSTLDQSIPANYLNETPFNQTVFARIASAGFCPVVVQINLIVNTPTKSTTLQDVYYICYGETLPLDAGSENVSWRWSTGATSQTENFTAAGNYTVELTNADGCSYLHDFIISDENQPIISVNQSNTSIEVTVSGGKAPYIYYFNGIPQPSHIFSNPTESSYTVQVESATGCFGPPVTVYFIKVKNTFTPNGDGVNDYWTVENLDSMEEVEIIVSDRNGRTVFRSNNKNNITWDGKTGGRELPTDTYWYVVKWFDPVTQKSEARQGWVLLKNRN